jgi:hypothetical protein
MFILKSEFDHINYLLTKFPFTFKILNQRFPLQTKEVNVFIKKKMYYWEFGVECYFYSLFFYIYIYFN